MNHSMIFITGYQARWRLIKLQVNYAGILHNACFVQAIAKHKLRRMIASAAPFITCFMVSVFTVKKSMRQAEENGFIHQLLNEPDEM